MKIFIVSLFVCSCIMTLVSIIYMALSSSLENWSAKRRYNLWLIILLGFLTPVKPFISDHLWKITLKAEEASTVVNNIAPTNTVASQSAFDVTKILFIIWIIGAIIFAVKLLVSHYKFKNYLFRHSTPCDADISDLTEAVAKQMKIKKVRAVKLKGISSPMMTGLKQATVILPEREYSQAELRLIIKHELYHFKKRDLLYKVIFLICKTIHWFNPIMAIIERETENICELACDERVIQNENKNDRKAYCQAILNSASLKKENQMSPILSSNFVGDKNNLKHRLSLIIANTKKKRFTFISVIIILLTLLSGTVFGVAYDDSDISNSTDREFYETTTVFYIPDEASTSIPMVTDQNGNTMVTDQYGNFFEYEEGSTALMHLEETTTVQYSEQSYENTEPAQETFTDIQATKHYRATTMDNRETTVTVG